MTLFADASFDPKTGAAGWGSWAIRDDWDRGRYQGGPIQLSEAIDSSNTAEIAGIALALWQHQNKGDLLNVTSLMIQCDNVAALGIILRKIRHAIVIRTPKAFIGKTRGSPISYQIVATVADLVGNRRLYLKHVKGHTTKEDGRSWVNRHCDREARRHMLTLKQSILVP